MTLGDDHPYRVIGVGSVRIKMFDGVIQTLTHVEHISDLKKNLVSLGYLERNGFNFSYRSESGI